MQNPRNPGPPRRENPGPPRRENPGPTLLRPIATGRTAEIYVWPEGKVLKLFYDWFGLENIEYEAQVASAIHASGLPVPAVSEIMRVNERYGLVYERVDGSSMRETFMRQPWSGARLARRMAELHARMHAGTLEAPLPSQRQKLAGKIQHAKALNDRLRAKALAALEGLPDGDRLCHGDFHPDNILITARGEVIIDWIDASLGNPLADLARTTLLVLGAAETSQLLDPLMKVLVRRFHAVYLRRYFKLRPDGIEEYRRWLPVVAAARLSEEIPEVEKWLLEQVERG